MLSCRSLLLLAAVGAGAYAPSAAAIEFGILRPLQHGPIGDSPEYADLEKYDAEAALGISRTYGSIDVNDDPGEKIDAARFHTRAAVGGAWQPTKTFTLSAMIDSTLYDSYTEQKTQGSTQPKLDTGLYRHELDVFAFYDAKPFVFGGGIGLLLYAANTREFDQDAVSIKEDVGTAAMPTLNLFGGIMTKEIDVTMGLRLFSKGDATVDYTDSSGTKQEFDVSRRDPAEIHLDGRLKFKEAQVAATLSYLLTGQASESIDEYSTSYTTTANGHKVRDTGGYSRDTDQFRAAIGGKFDPSKMFELMGSLTYFAPYYAQDQFVSIEDENLGGFRIDLGTEIHIQKFRGFFQAGYEIDNSVSFTQDDNSRSTANDGETLRPPLAQGDSVKVTQGKWELTAGGGFAL